MSYCKRVWVPGLAALGVLLWAPAAQAEKDGREAASLPICWAPVDWPGSPGEAATLLGAKPLGFEALGQQRGGAQTLSVMKLEGVVADNHASDLATGQNVITNGAFSGAAGLPMVIQNSGNNVLIQNATIVNVQVQ